MIPPKLNVGDTVGVITPSGTIDKDQLLPSLSFLKSMGFSVVLGSSVFAKNGYLAGSDLERASDIHEMFTNREIKAIFSARGGYGSLRILPELNYSSIKRNPKILVGFSDTTALQLGIFAKTGLITYSGLLLGTDITKNTRSPELKKLFLDTFIERKNAPVSQLKVIKKGKANGKVLGGCLSLVCSLAGTPFMPAMNNAILVIEDVNEVPYRIDRMLTQLKLTGILKQLKGLVYGVFNKCGSSQNDDDALWSLFEEFSKYIDGPVLAGLPYGHIPNRLILPIGTRGTVSTKGELGKIEFVC